MNYIYILGKSGKDFVFPATKENVENIEILRSAGDVSFMLEVDVEVREQDLQDGSYYDVLLNKIRALLNSNFEKSDNPLLREWLDAKLKVTTVEYLDRLLKRTKGNVLLAAEISGYNRKTIYQKALNVGLDLKDYRS